MKDKIVKYQIVGLAGENKNVVLTKNFIVPNAVDGHFETDRETGAMLEEALNIPEQPLVLLREDHPDYVAPKQTIVAQEDSVESLKESLARANAKITILTEDNEDLKKELDKALAGKVKPETKTPETKTPETKTPETKGKDKA